MLKKYRLNFEPGERWAYCNAGFVLLGFIVHKVSGMPLPQFMKQNFFDPLGMKETQYVSVSEIIPNRASGYSFDDNNKLSNGMYISNFYSSLGDMGIITTAGDMAKWSIALDKKKILDKETLEQMWTPAQLKNGMEVTDIAGSYGLGWGVEDYRGYKLLGHTGSFGSGYAADFIRFPEKNLSVIILTNLNSTESRWISCNLAGFFSPELKGIDQLSVQQNKASNPTKVYALLKGLGNDNLDTSVVTSNFKQRVNPMMKLIFSPEYDWQTLLHFLRSDSVINKVLLRYAVPVKKINYYQLKIQNKIHYLAIYFTADNKIADMAGY
jgi:CubicO group peptidase (beta-lactamase class C family)